VRQQASVDEDAEGWADGTMEQHPPMESHNGVAGDVDPEALAEITRTVQVEMAQQVPEGTICSRSGMPKIDVDAARQSC
jgi:hypothetical protein